MKKDGKIKGVAYIVPLFLFRSKKRAPEREPIGVG